MHQDGRVHVQLHCGERTLAPYIRHRHTGSSPGTMVWGAIGYTSWSLLVRIDGTLNSAPYISGVLRPVALPFIRVLRNPIFKQVDELWYRFEPTWSTVPVHAIQSLFDSMPKRISAVIVVLLHWLAELVVFGTDFLGSMQPNFLQI
ncbi:uncharacterized protein TNCV_4377131 [Trichonephila clavipes]|nr:uncharacterized protein TNCV_4377131 [Trichonephila clavipes]